MKTGLLGRGKLAGGFGLLLALTLIVSFSMPAFAFPQPPHQFWGNVTVCGGPESVDAGTEVLATIDEVPGMEWTTTVDALGRYGFNEAAGGTGVFTVDADDTDPGITGGSNGDTVRFFILGKQAGTAVFQIGGPTPLAPLDLNITEVDLTVTSDGCCPITVGALGTVPAGGTDTFTDITCGTVVQLTATAGDCCIFDGWEVDGSPVAGNPINVTMDAFHTAVATCHIPDYDLTVTSDGCCPITVGTLGTVPAGGTDTFTDITCGTVVQLTATAGDCCIFDGWEVDGSPVAGNPINVTMDAFHTAVATCHIPDYDLTVASSTGGSTTPTEGTHPYTCGTVVDLVAEAETCYVFVNWTGDVASSTSPTTTVTMDGDKTVTANFVLIGYELTVASTTGGEVTTPGEGTVIYGCGSVVGLVAEADPGYMFVDWTGDVANYLSPTTTVTMNGNKTVTANFTSECTTHELTVGSTAGGSVTDPTEGTHPYCEDEVVGLVAEAEACYVFVNWTGDVASSTSPTTTVTMDSDKTVTANFTMIEYDLTVGSTTGGSVTAPTEGTHPYTCGTVVDLVAEAASGYKFVNWTGAVANPTSATTTVTMNGDKTVTANFTLDITYDLTVVSAAGGEVTTPGEGLFQYEAVTVVDLVAEADTGRIFIKWTGDVGSIADVYDATTTITMDGDYEIAACFGLIPIDVPLDAGWSTFAVPFELNPCAKTWLDVWALSDLGGVVEQVLYYGYDPIVDASYWMLADYATAITPMEGFYVKMLSADTVSVVPYWDPEGPPAIPPCKELSSEELNFVGHPLLSNAPVNTALIDVYEVASGGSSGSIGYTRVYNPMENPNDWIDDMYIRDAIPVPTMVVYKAYWIKMANPGGALCGVFPPAP